MVAVATTLPGRAGDGTPEFVLTLAAALPSSRVVIVAPRIRNGRLVDESDGVEIRRVPYARVGSERVAEDAILPALRAQPLLARQLPRLLVGLTRETLRQIDRLQPDLIHTHWIVPAGLLGYATHHIRNVPYVVTAHGADAYALNGRVGRWLKKLILQSALVVYPVSADIANRLEPLAGERLGPTFPMGVDTERLQKELGERQPQQGVVLFVGRLSDKKGVDVLLRALAVAPTVVELRIVGDGPDRAALEQLAGELDVRDRVAFIGHASRAQVLDEYRRANVVVVPSRIGSGGDRDGTPVVLMEAMALGLPVVASSLGGIADQVESGVNGWLVQPEDPDALASSIAHVLAQPEESEQLARAAATRARESFDIHAIGTRIEQDIRTRLAER